MAIDPLQETLIKLDEIDSFKAQIYQKAQQQQLISADELDRLLINNLARQILEVKKLKLLGELGT